MDLQSSTCQEAMLIVRRAILQAQDAQYTGELLIKSINEGTQRHLSFFLETINDNSPLVIRVESVNKVALSEKDITDWVDMGAPLDDDHKNYPWQWHIIVKFLLESESEAI
tara:strand:+ start:159 stop:491 length:333 start_codon:yes stop_codon:yes gene_type:complete